MKRPLLILVASALTLVMGCEQRPSLEETQATLCDDLDSLKDNIAALADIGPNATIGELREARTAVADSFAKVKASAAAVKALKVQELEQAYEDLDSTVSSVSDETTISDAIASVRPTIGQVRSAWTQLYSGASCQ